MVLRRKKRFLYLRSCQLFTYDTRLDFLRSNESKKEIQNAPYLLNKILTNEIDLENMTDNKVNCLSWSKAYKKILKELLNTEVKVVNNENKDHYWVNFGHKADATYNSDLTRVKMNLFTLGYELSTHSDKFILDNESKSKIKIMDQNIKYITKNYCHLSPLIYQLQCQFQDMDIKEYDQLFWWMERLRETYLHFQPNLPYFEDAFIDFLEIPYLDVVNYVVNYVANLKGFGKELLLKR